MLKNKIYNYLGKEIFKSLLTILFAFTTIAWTVRAVNFLDLMVEDGYAVSIYLQYSIFNISTIITRFIPISFLLALVISIVKFERQQELLIIWTSGTSKLKLANQFFYLAILITFIQIFFAVVVTPTALNKSRSLLKNSDNKMISSVIKSNDYSDVFKSVTFYVDKRNEKGEMLNIFIRDETNLLSEIINESEGSSNTTIVAKKGNIKNNKLILFDGSIQSQNKLNQIKLIDFQKTELIINDLSTRTITQPKIQETSTFSLLNCLVNDEYANKNRLNCPYTKNNSEKLHKEVIENLARRIVMPLYIPLVALIASFLLIYKKEKKFNFIKKYIFFILGFLVLIFGEIMVRYSGISKLNFLIYTIFPILLLPITYFFLFRSVKFEKKI